MQQRQRASALLEVAARYPSFPIILETVREVLNDVYDLPGLRTVDHVVTADGMKAAWFTDSEGNVLCLHQQT